MNRLTFAVAVAASCGGTGLAYGIDIVLDFSNDTYFATSPTAKFAMEGAAADLSLLITTSLNPTVDTNVGEGGTQPFLSTTTFNHEFSYTNPSDASSTITVSNAAMPADEFRVFVGMRPISGSTLGVGGPAGAGFSSSSSYYNATDLETSILDGAVQSSANMSRGGGPTIFSINSTVSGTPISIDYGPTLGRVAFDNDTDNNGVVDSSGQLESSWHFDHFAPVAAGKDDFYSVALHEILHALGYGTADSWDARVSGTNWTGTNVNNLTSGIGLVDPDGAHLTPGTFSTSWVDGSLQEVAMDPNLTVGTRKQLTLLDVAILQDIGWDVQIPDAGDSNNDGEIDQADLDILLANFGATVPSVAAGDWTRDSVVDIDDLNLTLRNWTGSAAPVYNVPEPGTAALLALASGLLVRRRLRK